MEKTSKLKTNEEIYKVHTDNFLHKIIENKALLRSQISDDENCFKNNPSEKEIKEVSVFYKVPGFHVIGNRSIDLMHNFLESVIHFTMADICNNVIYKQKIMTLKFSNHRIKKFLSNQDELSHTISELKETIVTSPRYVEGHIISLEKLIPQFLLLYKSMYAISSLAYEKVCVLFNIAALQSSVASTQSLESDEGLKTAAKLFQTEELFSETFKLFQKEIFRAFWDKEWIPLDLRTQHFDTEPPAPPCWAPPHTPRASLAKGVVAQTLVKSPVLNNTHVLGPLYSINPLITGKQLGYRGMSEYYQSLVCKNNKQIGEEIARLEFAAEMFKVAQTKSNRLTLFEDYYNKTLRNLTEVKRDNDFIYHERIPDFKSLSPVSKAHVAKLLPLPEKFSSQFQVHDALL
ncbi:hypothetical protein TSAR_009139 [Trichomalopsis sarcophagae]|uniref:BRO1 domain-containing protein n=1 Tax=Trichomalopsis sarcophagae TaxID=543379 RepID=A0A232FC12_9HYME|nr:hypothetical protein TSAR_009139 [Trichomalopsis sarcophagae]